MTCSWSWSCSRGWCKVYNRVCGRLCIRGCTTGACVRLLTPQLFVRLHSSQCRILVGESRRGAWRVQTARGCSRHAQPSWRPSMFSQWSRFSAISACMLPLRHMCKHKVVDLEKFKVMNTQFFKVFRTLLSCFNPSQPPDFAQPSWRPSMFSQWS